MKFLLKLAKFVAKFVIFLVALSACVRLYAWQERRGRQTCADRNLRSQAVMQLFLKAEANGAESTDLKSLKNQAKAINQERCQKACKRDDLFCRKQEKGEFA